ncbi:hypothetical protein [Desmospora activa]|uniref:Uncharacterized protein n=1 Tax=Desmospora activa DSM 45169 TaxID=1121389 RepID=A0A2T4Z6M1_9BACL|nr:hypothetical protein [Desmospora activa]PTM57533.1 hypothetical protein C8J48_0081 [Desmospora activa DSM 45169]
MKWVNRLSGGLVLVVFLSGCGLFSGADQQPDEEKLDEQVEEESHQNNEDTQSKDEEEKEGKEEDEENNETLGDAPFDPCTVVSWDDFPQAVKEEDRTDPKLQPPNPGDPFDVRCKFSTLVGIDMNPDGSGNPENNTTFFTIVVWGKKDKISANTADHPGSTSKVFGSLQGLEKRSKNDRGIPMCTSIMSLPDGSAAGVVTTNNQYPSVDGCEVNQNLLEVIAEKMSK